MHKRDIIPGASNETKSVLAKPTSAIFRNQSTALYAYKAVSGVPPEKRSDYRIAVNDLGVNILRGGLAASVAAVERLGERGKLLLKHLAEAQVSGLDGVAAPDLPDRVRQLDCEQYMITTREVLRVATWLKRAVQATFGED